MIHWSFLLTAAIWAYVLGEKRGWKSAQVLVLGWRRQSRDWRYAFERATANGEAEIEKARQEYQADLAKIEEEAAK